MRVTLPSGTPAELSIPDNPTGTRGVVIAPDIMGLRPLFDDLASGLAAERGWPVCAVEPFPGQESVPLEERLRSRLDAARITRDLELGADLLQERTGVAAVAVIGFCMGGMNAFRAAGTGRFDRAVAFYGMIRPPEHWSQPGDDPLDAVARPQCCPVLAICGGADRWTPAEDIDALRRAGDHVRVEVYEGADHGFVHDPSRPAHRADDAAHAWRLVREFLA